MYYVTSFSASTKISFVGFGFDCLVLSYFFSLAYSIAISSLSLSDAEGGLLGVFFFSSLCFLGLLSALMCFFSVSFHLFFNSFF
jgi:hypothetical protein